MNDNRPVRNKLLKPLFGSISYIDYDSLTERIENIEKRVDEIAIRLGIIVAPTSEEIEKQKEDKL
jgi:hypothetical protein